MLWKSPRWVAIPWGRRGTRAAVNRAGLPLGPGAVPCPSSQLAIQLSGDHQLLLLLMPYSQAGEASLGEKSTANVFSDGCTRIGEGESLIFEVGFLSLWREDGLDGLPIGLRRLGNVLHLHS